ncbi:MAG: hypothetical protein N2109_00730 [Fimbriimonadales bacterium]|nr:hypothetical protein [Fimbriimonadales bacterium]
MRKVASLAMAAVAPMALAQGISVQAGYYFGESFSGRGAAAVRLEGVEIGAHLPLLRLPLSPVEVRLSPSVVLGGGLRRGSDDDGTIYRLMATAKLSQPGGSTYLLGGMGFARVEPRGGAPFERTEGAVARLAIGSAPQVGHLLPQPFFELAYTFGPSEFRGWTVSAGVRL